MTGVQTCALPICFPVTIYHMEKEKKFGQIMLVMKDNTRMVRNMVMESSIGLMDQPTLAILLITTYTETVSTHGQMDVSTTVSGTTTRCTALEFSLGMMDANMKVNTLTTKSKVTAFLPGQTVVSMKANGKMENNTV